MTDLKEKTTETVPFNFTDYLTTEMHCFYMAFVTGFELESPNRYKPELLYEGSQRGFSARV